MKYIAFAGFLLFSLLGTANASTIEECVHVLASGNSKLDAELENNLAFLGVSCLEENPEHAVVFLQVGRPYRKHESGSDKFTILVGVWVTYNDGFTLKEGEWTGESNLHNLRGKSRFLDNNLIDWGIVAEAIRNGKGNFHSTVKLMRNQ